MGIRLGVDFGTATMCAATVRDRVRWEPELIPLDGNRVLASSQVWVDQMGRELDRRPLVTSRSPYSRAPFALYDAAHESFDRYWKERLVVRSNPAEWMRWCGDERESAMLLSYFKPELADVVEPRRVAVSVEGDTEGEYDPMSQSTSVGPTYTVMRALANPAPDTDDYVAATAALLRNSIESAVARYHDKVEMLLIGVPSLGASEGERRNSQLRREEAVEAARIANDFGTRDFHVGYFGEAEAAAAGLDLSAPGEGMTVVIIDVGAGTTDLALVRFERGPRDRLVPSATLLTRSVRSAGRDVNAAIAHALLGNNMDLRYARRAMDADQRSWQLILDDWVEGVKRSLTDEEQSFTIRIGDYATHWEGSGYDEQIRRDLKKTCCFDLSLHDERIRLALEGKFKTWETDVLGFFLEAEAYMRRHGVSPVQAVELVGGALRFRPLRSHVCDIVGAAVPSATISFRDAGEEAQTVVARGLARQAALM